MPSSCVNKEVLKFNRQMEKRVKSYSNTKLLDLGLDRLYYTAHGQHLNSSGKEVIMNKLAVLIRDIFVKNQLKPIHLPWIESMDGSDQDQRTGKIGIKCRDF